MSALLEKIKKVSTIKETDLILDSKFFSEKSFTKTHVPMLNVALSGSLDGGLTSGVTILAGPSRHFKTAFAFVMASAFLNEHEDGVVLLYDSEFGSNKAYLENFDVDHNRVVHTPITDVEVLKHDLMVQLDSFSREDKVMIIVDSIGNLASKKETDDALDGKTVADMTRAKAIKSLFRIVTPRLNMKDIPFVAVNHTYSDMGLFPKQVMSGGQGPMLAADNVWIIGRRQEKEGKDIIGYDFIINIEKSRFVKEKSKIPVNVQFDGGVSRWTGLFDIALEAGYIKTAGVGWYQLADPNTGEFAAGKARKKDVLNSDNYWQMLVDSPEFKKYIIDRYKLQSKNEETEVEVDREDDTE